MRRNDLTSFDWDKGNIDKNSQKHGVSPNEAEEVFLDENLSFLMMNYIHLEKRD